MIDNARDSHWVHVMHDNLIRDLVTLDPEVAAPVSSNYEFTNSFPLG
jgi:hypothetical protein